MRVGTGVLDGPCLKQSNYGRGDHWSSVLFRLCFTLRANTVRPYRLVWITIMLVGERLGAPAWFSGGASPSPTEHGNAVTERGRDIVFRYDNPSQSHVCSTALPKESLFLFSAFRADDQWSPLRVCCGL